MAEVKPYYGNYDPSMGLADLHTHSDKTDGWLTTSFILENIEKRKLTAFGSTDHDRVKTGYDLREAFLSAGRSEEIVVGSEITAKKRNGDDVHIIGLYLEEDVKKYQSIGKTVDDIVKQGGLVVFPHPLHPDKRVSSASADDILDIAKDGTPIILETYNAGMSDLKWPNKFLGYGDTNKKTLEFFNAYQDLFVGQVGGTDAHYRTFARGLTTYSGDLRSALLSGTTGVAYRAEREKLTFKDWWAHHKKIQERAKQREAEEEQIVFDARLKGSIGFSPAD